MIAHILPEKLRDIGEFPFWRKLQMKDVVPIGVQVVSGQVEVGDVRDPQADFVQVGGRHFHWVEGRLR